ncbi:MAG: glycosyl hydrolase family 53 [Firmicutes bacterium]|nr:glycosyl hydrolase family 53 [Bacillota bacterium]
MIKGMTFGWDADRGDLRTAQARESLRHLRETGAEWIALAFRVYQDSVFSTRIYFDYGTTVTDGDLIVAVGEARELGLKICLKPVVNSRDGLWRGFIRFPEESNDSVNYWQDWFRSYRHFINHYAEIAEELNVDMFCVGCEMVQTEHRTDDWLRVVEEVRARYHGPLVYNANHGSEDQVAWFSAVDYVGTSAYYPVANAPGATAAEMRGRWELVKERLEKLYERFQRPILFMEIGCRSASGAAQMPWDFLHREWPSNEEEQAAFYESALETFWDESWFSGFFWWDWPVHLYDIRDAEHNTGFCVYGKKAEAILRQFYGGPR